MKRPWRLALLPVAALVLGSGAVVLGTAAPARAALEGTVTPDRTSGTTADAPVINSATINGACPEGFGDKIGFYLEKPDGFSPLSTSVEPTRPEPGTLAVTLPTGRGAYSLAQRLGTSGDGTYALHLRCLPNPVPAPGETPPSNPDHAFVIPIQVTGTAWQVIEAPDPVVTELTLTADPAHQVRVRDEFELTARITPAEATGTVTFSFGGRVLQADVPVTDGVARITAGPEQSPGTADLTASYRPADLAAYAPSSATLEDYTVVAEPGITVRDEDENTILADSTLEPGQSLFVDAAGYGAGETVEPGLALTHEDEEPEPADAEFTDATANDAGTVQGHELTLPGDLADGPYTLTLTGAVGGTVNSFTFVIGADDGDDDGGQEGDQDGDQDGGDQDGDQDGGDQDGATDGADQGADGASGDTGGDSGGDAAGAGALGGTGGSGGPQGPLASTGTDALALGAFGALLIGGGAFVMYRAHRAGRLRAFGITPR